MVDFFLNIKGQIPFGLLPFGEDGGSNGKNVLVESDEVYQFNEPRTAL